MSKEEIIKLLKKKQNRFYRQKSKGIAFNDDDYEANYILLYIENLQSKLDIANKKINDYNEMIIKVISECEEMINDRYYMNDTAILKKAELIKGIANHYYIVEPKWIGGE